MRILLLLTGLVLARSVQANCDVAISSSEFSQQVSLGDAAFSEMEGETFERSILWIDESLPCLSNGLSTGQVTSYHRLQALSAFSTQDPATTTVFFRAVLSNAPNYELPDYIAPDGHPLRLHFDVARGMPVIPDRPIPTPRKGWVQVDGQVAQGVPQDRPYVFQYFDENGLAVRSALLMPGEELPRYPASKRGGRIKIPLAVLSGVTAVSSGAFYMLSSQAEARFWDPETETADLESLQLRANGLAWSSLVMGAASVSTGVAAIWTRSF